MCLGNFLRTLELQFNNLTQFTFLMVEVEAVEQISVMSEHENKMYLNRSHKLS
jgi:hypothetical protein